MGQIVNTFTYQQKKPVMLTRPGGTRPRPRPEAPRPRPEVSRPRPAFSGLRPRPNNQRIANQ